jgi:hypothetical protein
MSPGGAGVPAHPEGWRPAPPDFVGVGASHPGTGWWHDLIAQHPGVVRVAGRPTELHYFDACWHQGLDEAAITGYHALFPRPFGALAGEWSPDYLQQAWTPALLRRAAPDARLLVMLADPVERFASELAATDERRGPPGRRTEPSAPTPRAAANAAFSRGLYADQLVRLWRAFPREQVLVLQYERCVADPRQPLSRTFALLGLAPEAAPDNDMVRPVQEPAALDRSLSGWQSGQLARHYAPENRRLAALVPELDLTLWRAPR